jgi:hypothetical protein
MLGLLIAIIIALLGITLVIKNGYRHRYQLIPDTTKFQALYCKDIRLFDNSTGNFFYRVYDNYNRYYYPPLSARYYLAN